jgi:hypothetical protein
MPIPHCERFEQLSLFDPHHRELWDRATIYDRIHSGLIKVHHNGQAASPPEVRFLACVYKDGPLLVGMEDPCWQWTGSRDSDGYGVFGVSGKTAKAHRFSFEYHVGTIPSGLEVMHRCDNPSCENPAHLRLGTNKNNIDDRHAKGRDAKGEGHGRALLTEDDVRAIRRRYKPGCSRNGIAALSREYGMSKGAIYHIVSGRNWKYVT